MFYFSNAVDNILTVAQNAGGFRTGKLTGVTASTESVRIDGTSKKLGFKGGFDAAYATFAANAEWSSLRHTAAHRAPHRMTSPWSAPTATCLRSC